MKQHIMPDLPCPTCGKSCRADIVLRHAEETQPRTTLWKILRGRGISLEMAQWICNDALNAGLFPQAATPIPSRDRA